MKARLRSWKLWAIVLLLIATTVGILVSFLVLANRDVGPWTSDLTITPYSDVIRFEAGDPVATLQVQIYDLSGKKVWDSGVISGWIVDWDRTNKWGERLAYGPYIYVVQGWSADGGLVLHKKGKLVLLPEDEVELQEAPTVISGEKVPSSSRVSSDQVKPLVYSHTGDWTVSGKLGVGTDTPVEKLEVNGNIRIGTDGIIYLPGWSPIIGSALNTDQLAIGNSSLQAYLLMPGINRGSAIDDGSFLFTSRYSSAYDNPADIKFRTYDGTTVTQLMVIKRSGRVGIGTLTPSATLEVRGSATNLLALYDPVTPTDPKFRVEKTGTVLADGAYYGAGYYTGSADVAERINTSEWVEKGDVVEIDPDHPGFFRKTRAPYSTRVAGVISTSPGVVLGNSFDAGSDQWKDNRPVLAITGRVPVKATMENGSIKIGDLLVSSSTPGYAMRCSDPQKAVGTVIGKAMESLEKKAGVIMVQVMLR